MPILLGLILMALGISLAVGQWETFLVVLRAVAALGCIGWGFISVLVGYSEMKARREYAEAITPDSKPAPHPSTLGAAVGETPKTNTVARDTPPVSPAQ